VRPTGAIRTVRTDTRARLAYGLRLLPAGLVASLGGVWGLALVLYGTAPAWLHRVPGALTTYRLLERGPGVLAAVLAAARAAVSGAGDLPGRLHTLPRAGLRLWLDRLALATVAWLLVAGATLAAARAYLPLPWGPALGTLVAPSALLAAVGFWAGSLWGSWLGEGAALLLWIMAQIRQLLRHPLWRVDPFLATEVHRFVHATPAETAARVLFNRWFLAALAAGLAALSSVGRAHPDRWGAWWRLFRPRLPGGLRAAPVLPLVGGLLAVAVVMLGIRPLAQRAPGRPLVPAQAVRPTGVATLTFTAGPVWTLAASVPIAVPPLATTIAVMAPTGLALAAAGAGGVPLFIHPAYPNGWAASGRSLGWPDGSVRTLRLALRLQAPRLSPAGSWPGLQIDGLPLGSVRVVWPAGATVRPAGAAACGPHLCWRGSAGHLALVASPTDGGAGA
jgi:hypothetical protein